MESLATASRRGRGLLTIVLASCAIWGASARAQPPDEPASATAFDGGGGDLGIARLEEQGYWVLDAKYMARTGPLRTNLELPLRFHMGSFAFPKADYYYYYYYDDDDDDDDDDDEEHNNYHAQSL